MFPIPKREFFRRISEIEGTDLTFDDVLLRPRFTNIGPADADVSTRFSRRIPLKMPIIGSPMDTVTEARMAIALACAGGIGVIHRNLEPEAQIAEVRAVKRYLQARIDEPITVHDTDLIGEVLGRLGRLSFTSFPVLDGNECVVGLVTKNNFRIGSGDVSTMSSIMTPLSEVPQLPEADASPEAAFAALRGARGKGLLFITREETNGTKLVGMYTLADLDRARSPNTLHNVDEKGRLRVAVAVGVDLDAIGDMRRLISAGADAIVIDTAHGDSSRVHEMAKALIQLRDSDQPYRHVDIVAGNVSTYDAAKYLIELGVDGLRVGQGGGSICTSRVVTGCGTPQISAIFNCARAVEDSQKEVPIIADGGIRSSGDMVLALAAGASSIMLGRLLAGTDEAPGAVETDKGGARVKPYRGMGSVGAMNVRTRDRYAHQSEKGAPEGVEGTTQYVGTVSTQLDMLLAGIRSGMGEQGSKTIPELWRYAEFRRVTSAGLRESHPHDLASMVSAPNYPGK